MNQIRSSFSNPYKSTELTPGAPKSSSRKTKSSRSPSIALPSGRDLNINTLPTTSKKNADVSLSLPTTKDIPVVGNTGTDQGVAAGASSWAGIAEGLMGLADIAINWGKSTPAQGAASGSAVGAAIGTAFAPGVGTAIGAAIGAIAGGLIGAIKTGKHKDQKVRDAVRDVLIERGVLSSDYQIGLADGTQFDIGIDGGPKKELGGLRPFEVDLNNPLAKYAISWMNPIFAVVSQGNEKIHTDFVGYLANAALSNAKDLDDVRANVNAIMKQFGLNDEAVAQATIQAAQAGLIDEPVAAAWLNGIEERRSKEFEGDFSSSPRGGAVFRAGPGLAVSETEELEQEAELTE
jgi:hypothetical protein